MSTSLPATGPAISLRFEASADPQAEAPAVKAIPHYGNGGYRTPQESAQHEAWVRQMRRYHPCDFCNGGAHVLTYCRECQGRGFILPLALIRKWRLESVLLPESEVGLYLSRTWHLDASDLEAIDDCRERAGFEEDPSAHYRAQTTPPLHDEEPVFDGVGRKAVRI